MSMPASQIACAILSVPLFEAAQTSVFIFIVEAKYASAPAIHFRVL